MGSKWKLWLASLICLAAVVISFISTILPKWYIVSMDASGRTANTNGGDVHYEVDFGLIRVCTKTREQGTPVTSGSGEVVWDSKSCNRIDFYPANPDAPACRADSPDGRGIGLGTGRRQSDDTGSDSDGGTTWAPRGFALDDWRDTNSTNGTSTNTTNTTTNTTNNGTRTGNTTANVTTPAPTNITNASDSSSGSGSNSTNGTVPYAGLTRGKVAKEFRAALGLSFTAGFLILFELVCCVTPLIIDSCFIKTGVCMLKIITYLNPLLAILATAGHLATIGVYYRAQSLCDEGFCARVRLELAADMTVSNFNCQPNMSLGFNIVAFVLALAAAFFAFQYTKKEAEDEAALKYSGGDSI